MLTWTADRYPREPDGELPAKNGTETDLSVILYTSGTTGRPNGAQEASG